MGHPARFACVLAALCAAPASGQATPPPISSHAQLYTCSMPYPLMDRIFAESDAMGAAFIRIDVEMHGIFEHYGGTLDEPKWTGLDEVMRLSRAYDLPVLGVIRGTPTVLSNCPERWPYAGNCAARDPDRYGTLAGEIADHAKSVITHWEIVNEPDGPWAFTGTPEEYARMLSASYDEIHRRVPWAQVTHGGLMSPAPSRWLARVFATPGANAATKFDIANIHLRGRVARLSGRLAAARAFYAAYGFTGPIWVTEHGYPSDSDWQDDPAYVGGEPAQARYLAASILELTDAGAAQVFLTLRDALTDRWASEGVVRIGAAAPFVSRRTLAFWKVRTLVDYWPLVSDWRAKETLHRDRATDHRAAARIEALSLAAGRARRRALRDERRAYAQGDPQRARRIGKRLAALKRRLEASAARGREHRGDAREQDAEAEFYESLVLGIAGV